MAMNRDTQRLVLGGTIGALSLAVAYGIYRNRKAILQPVFGPPSERGEYGRREHKKHKEHERGEHDHEHRGHERDDHEHHEDR